MKKHGLCAILLYAFVSLITTPAIADWYPASVDYTQTMRVILKETDVDNWDTDKLFRYFNDLTVSADGTKIAFKVKVYSSPNDHIFVANSDGTGLTDITGDLPPGILANSLAFLQLNDNGTRLFMYHPHDSIYYCDLSPASCGKAVENMYTGVPWIGRPYVMNSDGSLLYFKYNEGYDPVTQKHRLGIYTAGIGGAPSRLMHIDELPCNGGDCLDMYRLKLLGGSGTGNRLLLRWDDWGGAPSKAMWLLEGAGSPRRVPEEDHVYVWDWPIYHIVKSDGNMGLYVYDDGSGSENPLKLCTVNLNTGRKKTVDETFDINGFSFGPSMSADGKYVRYYTGRAKGTLANLSNGTKRDTWSYWFGPSGCIGGGENVSDLTTTGRYYYMGSRCEGANTAKIYRIDTTPTSFGRAPRITGIKFSAPELFHDGATTISVAATVTDPQGAANIKRVSMATLVDGMESPEWLVYDPLYFGWAHMVDDGNLGDEKAGDGVFTNNTIHTTINPSNFYTRHPSPWQVGLRIIAEDMNGNYTIADTTFTVTDHPLPIVSIAATDRTASEKGPDKGKFTITRTGSTDSYVVVRYSVGGSATNGTDYTTLPGTLRIPAGAASKSIFVTPVDDNLSEGAETVKVTLSSRPGLYYVGSGNRAAVTIRDNDTQ